MSELDGFSYIHDKTIRETGTKCFNIFNKEVMQAHKDFAESWYQDYQRRSSEGNSQYPYTSNEYGYLFH